MKPILTFFVTLLISMSSLAQNGINYKALIKDTNGIVLSNANITIQFTLLQGNSLNIVYEETHTPTTDTNGIVVLTIGQGATEGDIRDVEWSLGEVLLNVQMDIGSGLIDFGTTEFQYVPFAYASEIAVEAKNVTGLEAINEGNGIGWRLIGSDTDNYGNIGFAAIDLSYSNLESSTYGATGPNGTAIGYRTSSNGDSSIAIGSDNIASEDFSTAIGTGSTASGGSATALGSGNQATGNSSTAIGYVTTASGFASTTLGYYTDASGYYSTAIGNDTQAESHSSVAIGRYNSSFGNATTWNDFDPLFQIGNGTSDTDRHNALTVYKNGSQNISSSNYGLSISTGNSPNHHGIQIQSPGGTGLIISSPGEDGISISGAANNGIVISAQEDGARITGTNVGVYANGGQFQSDTPDIILGSSSSTSFSDDGIISTNPLRAGSDMFLRSYDAVVVHLDYDNNEAGNFRVTNGNGTNVFDVNESGTVNMDGNLNADGNLNMGGNLNTDGNLNADGRLRVGTATIENVGSNNFLQFNKSTIPSADGQFSLGSEFNRWANLWAVQGTIITSDRRTKTNIAQLNYGLEDILKLKPVSFNWKTNPNNDTKLGLIAQDLLKVIPEVVKTHTWEKDNITGELIKKELDRFGVYYTDLIPVLIKAIQEQQKTIDSQNVALSSQASEQSKIKNELEDLKALVMQNLSTEPASKNIKE